MLRGEVREKGHPAYFVYVSHKAVHIESNQNSKGCVGIVEGILEVQSLMVCWFNLRIDCLNVWTRHSAAPLVAG